MRAVRTEWPGRDPSVRSSAYDRPPSTSDRRTSAPRDTSGKESRLRSESDTRALPLGYGCNRHRATVLQREDGHPEYQDDCVVCRKTLRQDDETRVASGANCAVANVDGEQILAGRQSVDREVDGRIHGTIGAELLGQET